MDLPLGAWFHVANDQGEFAWSVERLWELARDLPVQTVPLESLSYLLDSKGELCLERPTLRDMAEYARAIQAADLRFPIILSAEGWLMDGRRRLCKALLLELDEIPVVRFRENPPPDHAAPKSSP